MFQNKKFADMEKSEKVGAVILWIICAPFLVILAVILAGFFMSLMG